MAKDKIDATDSAEISRLQAQDSLIGKGKFQQVKIAELLPFPHNARTADELSPEELAGMIERNGYDPSFPLTVSVRESGESFVLRGNRRLAAVCLLQTSKPEVFAKLFPKGTIPAIVLVKLTPADEVAINADHSRDRDRKGLTSWGVFLQIKALSSVGGCNSRFAIAEKLGLYTINPKTGEKKLQSSMVQVRLNLARLPQVWQDEYKNAVMFDGTDKRFHSETIKTLYSAMLADREHCAANGVLIGPNMSAEWDKIIGSEGKAPTGRKQPTAKTIEARANCTSAIVKSALLFATGAVSDDALTALIGKATTVESDAETLSMIREYLSVSDYAELVDAARTHRKATAPTPAPTPAATVPESVPAETVA